MPDVRILITGGTGFLGARCVDLLLDRGLDTHLASRAGAGPERALRHAVDLRDADAAAALVETVRPTHILHMAWIATPGRYATDPENLDWLRAGGAMLRTFREQGGERFVGMGTCFEYDWSWTGGDYSEDRTPIDPSTLYGKSKAAMWSAARAYAAGAFSAAWLRVFLPYGPGDNARRLIPSVIASLRAGEPIDLGSGSGVRDFIWAPEIADCAIAALFSPEAGVFNVGTGTGTSIREVVERVAAIVGRPELLRFGARPDAIGEPPSLIAEVAKARRLLGWEAKMTVEAGLEQLLETG